MSGTTPPGLLVLGRFEIRREIASFGSFELLRAFDQKSQTLVWLLRNLSLGDEEGEIFLRRGMAFQILSHPSFLRPSEAIFTPDDPEWGYVLVYPSLPPSRVSLGELQTPLHTDEIASLFGGLTDALAQIHQTLGPGVAKLEPSTIFVDRAEGQISWLLIPSLLEETKFQTRAGTVKADFHYASPETAKGLRPTPSSDYFSLGSVLFEAASGQKAFGRETAIGTLQAIVYADTSTVDHSPLESRVQGIVKDLLSADPAARLHDPNALKKRLTSASSSSFKVAASPRQVPPPPAFAERASQVPPPPAFAERASQVPPPPALTEGTREATARVLRRKAVVRYYERMNPQKLFPLLASVIQAESYIKIPEIARVKQAESDQVMEIKDTSPTLRLVPLLPGCLVTPPEATVDIRPEKVDATFWVTPLVEGDLSGAARLQIWHEGVLKDEIPLPIRVRKQTLTKLMSGGMLLSSLGGGVIEAYGKAAAKAADAPAFEKGSLLAKAIKSVVEILGTSGIVVASAFLVAAFLCYLALKPKRGEVIERFLTTDLH